MTLISVILWILVASAAIWTAYSSYCLYCNYLEALRIGVPVRILPISHLNKFWLLVDKRVTSIARRLPGAIGDNSFTRYNFRGWHEKDGMRSHDEMGDAFVLVTPDRNWLYIADPDALIDMYKRGKDFPRYVKITGMLDIFGPNIATASGEQWKMHRKIANTCLNEQCNLAVWSEAAALGTAMASYWGSKGCFTSVGEDTRTLSLNVLCKACFGKTFPFEGRENRLPTSPSASLRSSLLTIMENALVIWALGPDILARPWMPRCLSRLGEACTSFKQHMADMYEKEQLVLADGYKGSPTLMASLIRASQKEVGGLTRSQIYGDMFVFSFAGHDTTAHVLTFAMFFLAAHLHAQTWLSEELNHVLGDRPWQEWDYHADFPRLKRCQAVLYETLRLRTPVPEVKWTNQDAQSLDVGSKTLTIPPGTLINPSYLYVHKHSRFWGPDALTWRPSRWIKRTRSEMDSEILLPPPSRGNFLGWSEGARNCPGKKFSQVEWVATMAALFRDWEVEPLRLGQETLEDAQNRLLDFMEKDTDYGGLLLQLMHPERVPLVWKKR